MPHYQQIELPTAGSRIVAGAGTGADAALQVPAVPIVPFVEGDGIGPEITAVMRAAVDAAVAAAYGGARRIAWMEVYAGAKAARHYDGEWYPAETLDAISEFAVAIQGPLALPIGGGFRSLNVALRQTFDLYAAVSPIAGLPTLPAPLRQPERFDLVLFRETVEDAYAAIEWKAGSPQAQRLIDFLREEMGVKRLRFPDQCAIGIKPVSEAGCKRLVRRALRHALAHGLPSVTLVHKGNVMRQTEGAFQRWGYEVAMAEFGAQPAADGASELHLTHPVSGATVVVRDLLADAALPAILAAPERYHVLATLNVTGDFLVDALAAQVGAIGIAPCASLGDRIALFEVTHGPAPQLAGSDCASPLSLLLAAVMLLQHLGWEEAATALRDGLDALLAAGIATAQPAPAPGAVIVGTSEFGARLVAALTA